MVVLVAKNLDLCSEKVISHSIELIRYNPSMDLVALVSSDQQVLIYRLNGQRVYGSSRKALSQESSSPRVDSIAWKPNGQLLAIAWSDGLVRLVGAESTKVVHEFSTGEVVSGVTCMAWAHNFTGRRSAGKLTLFEFGSKTFTPWKLKELIDNLETHDRIPDLPQDLALIDVETSLPKLSVLAAGGGSEEAFSSRASLDALFQPFDPKDNDQIDVMVVGTKDGGIHLSIYDSFVIGCFERPLVMGSVPLQVIMHTSRPCYSTHSLLMKSSRVDQNSLYIVPMDLRFVSASSNYLSLLASKSTTLQNLLRYLHQVQVLMLSEWNAARELPAKFLLSINEDLAADGKDIVHALYHSISTGHTFPLVREWLVLHLAERGHKRWDKSVTTGLENLRRLVHENMLPALDRCSVILSRFAGIAKFQGSNDSAGFSSHQIALMSDSVACLHLVASRIILQVVEELDLFTAFSAWMRYEIDRLASESSSTANEDSVDKEASIDHGKVLSYLQTRLTSTPLSIYFSNEVTSAKLKPKLVEDGLPVLEELECQLKRQEQGLSYIEQLPHVDMLLANLTDRASSIFSQIAKAEMRNVLFGEPQEIGSARSGTPMDMQCLEVKDDSDTNSATYVAFLPEITTTKCRDEIRIVRVSFFLKGGISSVVSIEGILLQLLGGTIKDIKFVMPSTLMVLWQLTGESHLLAIEYSRSDLKPYLGRAYKPIGAKQAAIKPQVYNKESVISEFSEYTISHQDSFVPVEMEIEDFAQRLVLLGEDRLHYKAYMLPDPVIIESPM